MNLEIEIPPTPSEDKLPIRPPMVDELGILRIDNSSLERFTTCARSAQYYLLDRREPAGQKGALYFGSAIHAAMELLYTKYDGQPSDVGAFLTEAETVMSQFFPAVADAEEWRTLERAMETLVSYMAATEFDNITVYKHNGEPFVEQYFECFLGNVAYNSDFNGKHYDNIEVRWTGRIDLVVEQDNHLWIMDHKTTSILGTNFYADFLNSSQTMGYTWAAQQVLGRPIAGLYLNAIASRKPSRSGTPFELARQKFHYTQDRLVEWEHNTLTLVADFLAHCDRGFFPMETKWCVGKYGQCPYLDICTLPVEGRAMILQSGLYQDVTWTPKR